jgi:hypothetical protein
MDKINLFFGTLRIIRKLHLQPFSNIELFPTHTELGVFGVARNLVQAMVHLQRWNFEKCKISSYMH